MKTQPQKQRRKKLRRRPHYPRIFALLAVLAFIFGGVYAQLTVPEGVAAAPSAPQQSARQKTVAEAATRPAPAEEEAPAEEKRIGTLAEAVPKKAHTETGSRGAACCACACGLLHSRQKERVSSLSPRGWERCRIMACCSRKKCRSEARQRRYENAGRHILH